MQELWIHQKEGIEKFKSSQGSYGFFFDVGTGKTRAALECLRYTYNFHGQMLPTLIISPLITLENWKREILKYTKIEQKNIAILHGSSDKKRKILASKPKIIITNYESFLSDYVRDHFAQNVPMFMILDEAHYIKTYNSKRTKYIHKIADSVPFKLALTGTPVLNSAEDLWSILYFLDKGKRLESKHHFFKVKYFFDKNANMPSHKHFPDWNPRPGSREMINSLISDVIMTVKKEDCLDLPPLLKTEVYAELSGDQKKAYEAMKKDFIAYVNDAACVATLALTKALRLQQILSGYMPLDDDTAKVFEDNNRLDVLEELLTELTPNHKVIVWAPFKMNHAQIGKLCGKLNINHVYLTGEQTKAEKDATMEAFENDPSIRVCVGNQSVGIGVNLISSDVMIYFSRTFNLAHDIQSEARNYRAGSEIHKSVTRYDIVVPETIDEKIQQALRDKKEIGAELLKKIAIDL
jgi:non-specific serine/threonine protein kinase